MAVRSQSPELHLQRCPLLSQRLGAVQRAGHAAARCTQRTEERTPVREEVRAKRTECVNVELCLSRLYAVCLSVYSHTRKQSQTASRGRGEGGTLSIHFHSEIGQHTHTRTRTPQTQRGRKESTKGQRGIGRGEERAATITTLPHRSGSTRDGLHSRHSARGRVSTAELNW
jgi:hypothetical protein